MNIDIKMNNIIKNRTKEERQAEIKPIIIKLKELKLNMKEHPEIKELFTQMQRYINEEVKVELDIPFPAYNCSIKGVLSINKGEKVWVKLETHIM
jgi:hypothetical protein